MTNYLCSVAVILVWSIISFAQAVETFDIVSFKTPRGWQKEVSANSAQLGTSNSNGTCLITIFKPIPGSNDTKENFKYAWDNLVKATVTVKAEPEMRPAVQENGWIVESGVGQYESSGKQGAVVLVTISGNAKMINILIFTDTAVFQNDIGTFLDSVTLPKVAATPPTQQSQSTYSSRFKFATTTFDDGWKSFEDEYWVRTTNGSTSVDLYYFFALAEDMRPPYGNIRDNVWRRIIGKRFRIISENEERRNMSLYEWKEGEAIDNATGQKVYLAMVWSSNLTLAISPSRAESLRLFPNIDSLVAMSRYNKFAIGDGELNGTWQSGATNLAEWYNANTGAYAGATIASVAAIFTFSSDGNYTSVHNGATGNVIGMNTFNQQYRGRYKISSWTMTATNRFQGKTVNFDASFQAVRGGRLLALNDHAGSEFLLVKTK